MKRLLLFALFASFLSGCSSPQKTARHKLYEYKIAGWGTAIDPDRDCKFFTSKDSLLISVPGSHPHDLAADIDLINAPRILQNVHGDFTIQVKVDGRFAPGGKST